LIVDDQKPTYAELIEALEGLIYPGMAAKLWRRDGKSAATRGMDLISRHYGREPLGVPRAPRVDPQDRPPTRRRPPPAHRGPK